MYTTALTIFGSAVMFLAGLTQGFSGFGISVVAIPLLVLFFPPKVVVSAMIIWTFFFPLPILFEGRKWLHIKRILPLVISGVIFTPIGAYLLIVLNPGTVKIIAGGVVVLFSLLLLFGFKKKIKNEKVALGFIGMISGTLKGVISMSGPPVVLFLTNQAAYKHVFRVHLTAYFFLQNLVAIVVFLLGGLLTIESAQFAALFFVPMILGILTGIAMTKKVRELTFRKIVLLIVILSGISAIFSGIKLYFT